MNKLFLWCLCSLSLTAQAQEQLSLSNAIELALTKNYAIRIAKTTSQISQQEVTYGNAGMLPQVALNAGEVFANNNTKQSYSNGNEVDKKNALSNNLNSGIALNWTLFDGMKMFVQYKQLSNQNELSKIELKRSIEGTVNQIIIAYYAIVKEKQLINRLTTTISYYQERLQIATEQLNIGSGSRQEMFQAKVDLNEQQALLLQAQINLTQAKSTLNQLLAQSSTHTFDVSDSIPLNTALSYESLKVTALHQNYSLQLAQKNMQLAKLAVSESKSLLYPKVGLSMNYNFTRADNQAGFILLNQNLGFNAGLNASWTLFNGYNNQRQINKATLSQQIANTQLMEVRAEIDNSLYAAFQTYTGAVALLNLEQENVSVAAENQSIAMERYRLGSSSAMEWKNAQQSYEAAQNRLLNALYAAKLAETSLLRLNGMLVQ